MSRVQAAEARGDAGCCYKSESVMSVPSKDVHGPGWGPADPVIEALRTILERLQAAVTPEDLFAVAAAEIKRLTGYDRVTVYRFGGVEETRPVAADPRRDMVDAGILKDEARSDSLTTRVPTSEGDQPIDLAIWEELAAGAKLGLALTHGKEPWGMILCHHQSEQRSESGVPAEVRDLCELTGQIVSTLLGFCDEERARARRDSLPVLSV